LKFKNLTIFSLLKLKRTFVYTVINHFFNKWWCTFVTLPENLIPDDYTLYAQAANGCNQSLDFTIDAATEFILNLPPTLPFVSVIRCKSSRKPINLATSFISGHPPMNCPV
jgi:hypothetical protein